MPDSQQEDSPVETQPSEEDLRLGVLGHCIEYYDSTLSDEMFEEAKISWKAWIEHAKKNEWMHHGDCTSQAETCPVCTVNEGIKMTKIYTKRLKELNNAKIQSKTN